MSKGDDDDDGSRRRRKASGLSVEGILQGGASTGYSRIRAARIPTVFHSCRVLDDRESHSN